LHRGFSHSDSECATASESGERQSVESCRQNDGMSDAKLKALAWYWWLAAAGMFPLSLAIHCAAFVGVVAGPNEQGDIWDAMWRKVDLLSQFVAFAGVIWIGVLCVLVAYRFLGRWIGGRSQKVR
jgi:hypothetical protein